MRRFGKAVDRFTDRFTSFEPFDILMFGMYVGLVVWGVWAQVEPPLSLVGAAGFGLARVITLLILVFSLASLVGIGIDTTSCNGKGGRLDIEFPALLGLAGSWLTYVVIVWLIVAGHGDPHQPPVLAVFGILATVFTLPFLVRLIVLIRDAIRTFRKARKAIELGLVGGEQ